MSRHFNRSAVLLSLAILAPVQLGARWRPCAGGAQGDDPRLGARTPVAGVEVVIQAANKQATTGHVGRLRAGRPRARHPHVVLVRSIGYRPISLRAYLVAYDTLEVDLVITKAAVELAPLEVTATAIPLGLDDFERRRMEGFGQFVDWTSLRQQDIRRLSDIFREHPRRADPGQPERPDLSHQLPGQLSDAGLPGWDSDLSGRTARPRALRRPSISGASRISTPSRCTAAPRRRRSSSAGRGAGCGTVLLWTRRHSRELSR